MSHFPRYTVVLNTITDASIDTPATITILYLEMVEEEKMKKGKHYDHLNERSLSLKFQFACEWFFQTQPCKLILSLRVHVDSIYLEKKKKRTRETTNRCRLFA